MLRPENHGKDHANQHKMAPELILARNMTRVCTQHRVPGFIICWNYLLLLLLYVDLFSFKYGG